MVNIVFAEEVLRKWTVELLKKYITDRGVTVSAGGSQKADLICTVLAADIGNLEIEKRMLMSMSTKQILVWMM